MRLEPRLERGESGLPPANELRQALETALAERDGYREIQALSRRPNVYVSTCLSEVVSCLFADGSEQDIFCKYSTDGVATSYGHRGGLAREAAVYEQVLTQTRLSLPVCYGIYRPHGGTGKIWLFLEWLGDVVRLGFADDADAPARAAEWIGCFHRRGLDLLAELPADFPPRYDLDYYIGWAQRTLQYASDCGQSASWLNQLCACFTTLAEVLLDSEQTVIHGEFYPKNILVREADTYPVDWESAAVGPGVIDLNSLCEGWSMDTAEACHAAYIKARWDSLPPPDYEQALQVSRIYQFLRWLGDRPDWTAKMKDNFAQLHAYARTMGLL